MSSDRERLFFVTSALRWCLFLPEFLEVSISGSLELARIGNQLEKKADRVGRLKFLPQLCAVCSVRPPCLCCINISLALWPVWVMGHMALHGPLKGGVPCVIYLYGLTTCLGTQLRHRTRTTELKESKCESCPDRRNFLEPFQGARVKAGTEGQNTGKWKGDGKEYPPDSRGGSRGC